MEYDQIVCLTNKVLWSNLKIWENFSILKWYFIFVIFFLFYLLNIQKRFFISSWKMHDIFYEIIQWGKADI